MASTSEVYGNPLEHPQRESYWGNVNPVGLRSAYDEAKRFGEALTTAYRKELGVNTAIARIFNTYGPRMRIDDGRAVPTFARQAIRGEPLTVTGDGRQTRSFCYVDDTVDGILILAQSDYAGPINIGSEEELTIGRLAALITEIATSRSPIHFVERLADDPETRRPNTELANEVLGWSPKTSLESGLKQTLAWFAERLAAEGHQA
jgi:dTDP-glucose 4,6-dehydratase